MALTLLEAAKLSQNKLFQGIALSIVTTDELAAAIPFKTFAGQAATYQREGTLPGTAFIPDAGTMPSPSTGTYDNVVVPIRRVGSDMDIDSLADDLDPGARATQMLAKLKATWRLVKTKIVSGGNTTSHTLGSSADPFAAIDAIGYGPWLDSTRFGQGEIKYTHSSTSWQFRAPGDSHFGTAVVAAADGTYTLKSFNASRYITVTLDVSDATANGQTTISFASSNDEFDGLNRIMSPSMVISSAGGNGDAFDLGILDQMISMEKIRSNRAFFMNSLLVRKFMAQLRLTGGANPEHMRLPGYSGDTIAYRGIPILENDNIPSTEAKGSGSTLSSVYLASLDADEGLFLGVPSTGVETLNVHGDPRREPVMGFRIESLGALEGVAHRRWRCQWYGTLGLRSDLALVRAREIVTA
jgi:hypothetical protein